MGTTKYFLNDYSDPLLYIRRRLSRLRPSVAGSLVIGHHHLEDIIIFTNDELAVMEALQ